jgi:hypothetical protein
MRKPSDDLPDLIEPIGPKKLKRITNVLLAFPIIVIATFFGLYFAFWRTEPLFRFIHMIWVLGFWTAGTVAIFAFIIHVSLKRLLPVLILIFAFLAIALAIYFTPLSRFTNLFPQQTGLILPATIGSMSILLGWLVILRFRNRASKESYPV